MSQTPLARVTARVAPFDAGDGTFSPRPLLALEEFFDGNEVVGSIWCNVVVDGPPGLDMPTPQMARRVLEAVRARDEVVDVRVAVAMFDDPDWPFADEVVVVTDADVDDVRAWFPEDVAPDEVAEAQAADYEPLGGAGVSVTGTAGSVRAGAVGAPRLVSCWWD